MVGESDWERMKKRRFVDGMGKGGDAGCWGRLREMRKMQRRRKVRKQVTCIGDSER